MSENATLKLLTTLRVTAAGLLIAGALFTASPLSRNWTVGAEYLYVDLGTISVTETKATGIATGNTFTSNSRFAANIARVTINYKFGP